MNTKILHLPEAGSVTFYRRYPSSQYAADSYCSGACRYLFPSAWHGYQRLQRRLCGTPESPSPSSGVTFPVDDGRVGAAVAKRPENGRPSDKRCRPFYESMKLFFTVGHISNYDGNGCLLAVTKPFSAAAIITTPVRRRGAVLTDTQRQ